MKHQIPLYGGEFTIVVAEDFKDVENKYDLGSTFGMDAFAFRVHDKTGYCEYVVCFHQDAKVGVIAHECLHMVHQLFADRRIEVSTDNDEPACYLLEWMVNKCNKFLKQ